MFIKKKKRNRKIRNDIVDQQRKMKIVCDRIAYTQWFFIIKYCKKASTTPWYFSNMAKAFTHSIYAHTH